MVSLWPWRGDGTSAESFERTLSGIAQKISKTGAKNDALRQRARKLKVGWTIYGGFTYILTALILILVTGWQNWGAIEYTTVAGGPVLLWGVRRLLTTWYDYRISNTQKYLDSLNKERDSTIERLKQATKYNSTQELIDKYSSKPTTPKQAPDEKKKRQSQVGAQGHQRVFTLPPPTANIPRGPLPPPQIPPGRPDGMPSADFTTGSQSSQRLGPSDLTPGAEFAPNAFSELAPSAPPTYGEGSWYDRILDALLGEDETSAKNRFALICSSCRLVNGQAPPGAKTLEDVGKWRCIACGTMNGIENETAKLVEDISNASQDESEAENKEAMTLPKSQQIEPTAAESSDADTANLNTDTDSPAASTRSKKKGAGKKTRKA
ncbi:uncharacterized protein PV09_01149 [Verruconis gallopava]|uniref:Endoplasmic reticulum junction formation protein lunapark n=1 Tax=Verruconis gallopava TaxID=253628 RepID=A0A0D1XZH3_9PEZI|nr:uncharacterized protein PV09_01149 [Verruconis gallopava]KIW08221.1 hypothetical protein PV09_01149 [Verruconis gallopava]